MSSQMAIRSRTAVAKTGPLKGWMVLAMILAFFGTIASVNGTMIYYALSTFSGEEEESPYEHGLAYDKDIAAARAQDALHWQVSAQMARTAPDGLDGIEITMRDASGKPVAGLAIAASLNFSADKKFDRKADLVEAAPGIYRASVAARAGLWDLVLEARRDGGLVFRSNNRIVLH